MIASVKGKRLCNKGYPDCSLAIACDRSREPARSIEEVLYVMMSEIILSVHIWPDVVINLCKAIYEKEWIERKIKLQHIICIMEAEIWEGQRRRGFEVCYRCQLLYRNKVLKDLYLDLDTLIGAKSHKIE